MSTVCIPTSNKEFTVCSYDMMCSNSQDEYGDTPLIIASQKGHVTTCALLVKRGATVDYQDKVRLDHFRKYSI